MQSRSCSFSDPSGSPPAFEPNWNLDLSALLTLNRAALLQVDRHGRILKAQGAITDLLGIEPEQAQGQWFRSYLPLQARDAWSQTFRTQILARRMHQRTRWQLERAGGAFISVEQTVALQLDNGVVVGAGFWINALPDIEDVISPLLESSEETTDPPEDHKAGQLLHRLLDHLPLMVFILRGTEVVYINPAVARLTGYNLDELRTSFAVDLVDTADWVAVFELIARCLETGQAEHFEQEFRHRGGSRRWADV